jgi:hypothetical protein
LRGQARGIAPGRAWAEKIPKKIIKIVIFFNIGVFEGKVPGHYSNKIPYNGAARVNQFLEI